MTLRVIVFSKDRPLQLHAYLESMLHYAEELPIGITVVTTEIYSLVSDFFSVDWVLDGDFDGTIRELLSDVTESHILFGCDDVIFFRSWSFEWAKRQLGASDVLGATLRLGLNVEGSSSIWRHGNARVNTDSVTWQWKEKGLTEHWCYPFEIMGTIYRKEDALAVLKESTDIKGTFKYPGDIETYGYTAKFGRSRLAMPFLSCCAAQDVNQVQGFTGAVYAIGPEFEVTYLREQYNHGRRLDWRASSQLRPHGPFLSSNGWRLSEKPTDEILQG